MPAVSSFSMKERCVSKLMDRSEKDYHLLMEALEN